MRKKNKWIYSLLSLLLLVNSFFSPLMTSLAHASTGYCESPVIKIVNADESLVTGGSVVIGNPYDSESALYFDIDEKGNLVNEKSDPILIPAGESKVTVFSMDFESKSFTKESFDYTFEVSKDAKITFTLVGSPVPVSTTEITANSAILNWDNNLLSDVDSYCAFLNDLENEKEFQVEPGMSSFPVDNLLPHSFYFGGIRYVKENHQIDNITSFQTKYESSAENIKIRLVDENETPLTNAMVSITGDDNFFGFFNLDDEGFLNGNDGESVISIPTGQKQISVIPFGQSANGEFVIQYNFTSIADETITVVIPKNPVKKLYTNHNTKNSLTVNWDFSDFSNFDSVELLLSKEYEEPFSSQEITDPTGNVILPDLEPNTAYDLTISFKRNEMEYRVHRSATTSSSIENVDTISNISVKIQDRNGKGPVELNPSQNDYSDVSLYYGDDSAAYFTGKLSEDGVLIDDDGNSELELQKGLYRVVLNKTGTDNRGSNTVLKQEFSMYIKEDQTYPILLTLDSWQPITVVDNEQGTAIFKWDGITPNKYKLIVGRDNFDEDYEFEKKAEVDLSTESGEYPQNELETRSYYDYYLEDKDGNTFYSGSFISNWPNAVIDPVYNCDKNITVQTLPGSYIHVYADGNLIADNVENEDENESSIYSLSIPQQSKGTKLRVIVSIYPFAENNEQNEQNSSKTYDVPVLEKTPVSVSIKSNPSQTTYIEGQPLDLTGGTITVVYNNGTSEDMDLSSDMISGYDHSKIGTQTVVLTCQGITTQFTVNVKKKSIENIEVASVPSKVNYIEGQSLVLSGGTIKVNYDNGTSETLNITPDMISGYDADKIGDQLISLSYQNKTASFDVNVRAKSLTELVLKYAANKTTYLEGQDFDVKGLVFEAVYDNGTKSEVTAQTEMISNYFKDVAGKQTITVTYNTESLTFSVNVISRENVDQLIQEIGNLSVDTLEKSDKELVNGLVGKYKTLSQLEKDAVTNVAKLNEAAAKMQLILFPALINQKIDEKVAVSAATGVIPLDASFKVVSKAPTDDAKDNIKKSFGDKSTFVTYLDFSLLDGDNKKIQPNGKLQIKVKLPEGYANDKNLAVVYVAPDGKVTDLNATFENGYAIFETDHFSDYAVVKKLATPQQPVPVTGEEAMNVKVIFVLVTLIATLVIARRKLFINKN